MYFYKKFKSMEAIFKIWETSRRHYLKFFDGYTLEQLNRIPEGFSNNLIWNIGHIIVSQQSLVYRLSGLPTYVSEEMTNTYLKAIAQKIAHFIYIAAHCNPLQSS